MIDMADRLKRLPPYLFQEIDRLKAELMVKGVDVINLGVGDPDLPTPAHIVEELGKAAKDPANHQYPSYSGMNDFKVSVAKWYRERFGVDLDPGTEVLTLIGSKEGIAHLPLAFINPGDLSLIPTPAYPVYDVANMFAGGESYFMPLTRKNQFLPALKISLPTSPGGPNFFSSIIRIIPRLQQLKGTFSRKWLVSPESTT